MASEQAALQEKVRELQEMIDQMPKQEQQASAPGCLRVIGLEHETIGGEWAICISRLEDHCLLKAMHKTSIDAEWYEFARQPVPAAQFAQVMLNAFPHVFNGLAVPR